MKNVKTINQLLFLPIKPIFPHIRSGIIRLGIVKKPISRQPYALGYLRKDVPLPEFAEKLRTINFHKENMAFIDPDEILGVRKLDPKNPRFQYHVRVYKNGEVRGHHERTPEDHPIDHFKEVGFEPRYQEFMSMFGNMLRPTITPAVGTQGKPNRTMPRQYPGPVRAMERGVAR